MDLNVKYKTFRKKRGEKIFEIQDQAKSSETPKAQSIKGKTDKLDLIKI